jgi:hypothetical protein
MLARRFALGGGACPRGFTSSTTSARFTAPSAARRSTARIAWSAPLLFVYEDGDLLYAQERIEEACEESEEGCGIDELVEFSPPDSVVVVMSESGIACGPYSFDVAVGLAVPLGREIDVNEIVKPVEEEEKGWKI